MQLTRQLIRDNRRYLALLIVLSLASGATSALLIATITRALGLRGLGSLPMFSVFFAVLSILTLACRHFHRYVVTIVSNKLEQTLRSELASVMLSCSLRELEKRRTPELMTVLTRDVETISGVVLSLPNLVSNIALLVGAIVYLGCIAGFEMLLGLLIVIACGTLLHARIVSNNMPLFHRIRDHYSALMSSYRDLAFGSKELKMDEDMTRRLMGQLSPESRAIAELNMLAVKRHSLGLNVAQVTTYVLLGAVVFAYPFVADVTPQIVSSYVMVILYALAPAESIANLQPLIQNARVALIRIEEFKAELAKDPEYSTSSVLASPIEEIKLDAVTYSYPTEKHALTEANGIGPITMNIERGEVVFIAGGNGSGKTTLAKIICGLYPPQTGSLSVNGTLVSMSDVHSYRQRFSVCFCDSHLLSSAFDPNQEVTGWKLSLAAKLGVAEMLQNVTNATIDELSTGQRKRLSLYFSIVKQKDVYLFDEPCAGLDPETKAWFYTEFIPTLNANRVTLIVVSHDDQFFNLASRLVVMRDGAIAADRLMSNSARFMRVEKPDRHLCQSPR